MAILLNYELRSYGKATQLPVTCFFKLDEPTGFSATASKKAIMAFGR